MNEPLNVLGLVLFLDRIKAILKKVTISFSLVLMTLASNSHTGLSQDLNTPKIGDTRRNRIGMEFVWIPSGSFTMGSPSTEELRGDDEGPQRFVRISQGFWMGKFEVTERQYESVMGKDSERTAAFSCGVDCPVVRVSWDDTMDFIRKLNEMNDGYLYSLPWEAEWEYAARAGTTTAFAFGDSLSSTQANFDGNWPYGNGKKGPRLMMTSNVGSYKPNAWGLYDMHGNVWEWVQDLWKRDYSNHPADGSVETDTKGPRGWYGTMVIRGGAWTTYGNLARSAYRNRHRSFGRRADIGFRVVARAK